MTFINLWLISRKFYFFYTCSLQFWITMPWRGYAMVFEERVKQHWTWLVSGGKWLSALSQGLCLHMFFHEFSIVYRLPCKAPRFLKSPQNPSHQYQSYTLSEIISVLWGATGMVYSRYDNSQQRLHTNNIVTPPEKVTVDADDQL